MTETTQAAGTVRTYDVAETRTLISREHINQVASVGRSDGAVHVILSEAAATALAEFLATRSALVAVREDPHVHFEVEHADDLWEHVAVDLLTAVVALPAPVGTERCPRCHRLTGPSSDVVFVPYLAKVGGAR